MKKYLRLTLVLAASALTIGLSSCSSDDDNNVTDVSSAEETEISNILSGYVDNVVNPTYTEMATHATTLYSSMKTLRDAVEKKNATQDQVQAACDAWLKTRACYEKSEAFLLGAASDYDIDPHIDTWPLDLTSLHSFLTSPNMLANVTTDDDDANISWAHTNLNQTQLGFHSVEFVIFRDGKARKVDSFNSEYDDFTDADQQQNFTDVKPIDELKFAVATAGDLMYSIYELEVCWNPSAPESHRQALENLEWKTTMPSSTLTYGENMKIAGKSGSIYTTVKSAASAILVGDNGCGGICDEVGQTKMGKPYGLKTTSENQESDPSYIESPYSYNSLTDFWDNIQSIKNTWYGKYTAGNNTDGAQYSFHSYFAKYGAEEGKAVETAIDDAQAKIKACDVPFRYNYHTAKVLEAINACTTLSNALTAANDLLNKQK